MNALKITKTTEEIPFQEDLNDTLSKLDQYDVKLLSYFVLPVSVGISFPLNASKSFWLPKKNGLNINAKFPNEFVDNVTQLCNWNEHDGTGIGLGILTFLHLSGYNKLFK